MENTVYYLPGMGGRLHTGLGRGISDRNYKIVGRETLGEFQKLAFQDKIDIVKNDLVEHFWYPDAKVVVNSFGAYLFLHAQLTMQPYPGSVLILSPIIGGSKYDEKMMRFYPPCADVLMQAANDGSYPCPANAQIHVGSEDWQSGPKAVKAFGKSTGISTTILDGEGHMLRISYVSDLLDRLLLQS